MRVVIQANNMIRLSEKEIGQLKRRIIDEMGATMSTALLDPATVEIMLNSDGKVWQEKLGGECECIGEMTKPDAITLFNTIAHSLGEVVNTKNPILEGRLIVNGARFEGVIPPCVENPVFAIRNQAEEIYTLDSYIDSKALTSQQHQTIIDAINKRKNILVVGSTGSGKTTFLNAVLDSISKIHPNDRVVTMEDTRELQVKVANYVSLFTSLNVSMRDLLKATMRLRPDKIIVGETRGSEALDLLKAWNTGHSGGISSVHANSAYAGLGRLEELCAEGTERPVQSLISEAVNLSIFITKTPEGRKIDKIIEITGYDSEKQKYNYNSL